MKKLTALALALALFTVPTVVLADDAHPDLSEVFDRYQETIVQG